MKYSMQNKEKRKSRTMSITAKQGLKPKYWQLTNHSPQSWNNESRQSDCFDLSGLIDTVLELWKTAHKLQCTNFGVQKVIAYESSPTLECEYFTCTKISATTALGETHFATYSQNVRKRETGKTDENRVSRFPFYCSRGHDHRNPHTFNVQELPSP